MLYAWQHGAFDTMSSYTLQLMSPTQSDRFDSVSSFVGEDGSGSFGLMAGHGRFMTSLVFGLARFRQTDKPWQFIAVPGAMVYFFDNVLRLTTRSYLISEDYERVASALEQQLYVEEQQLRELKGSLHEMEQTMLRKLWDMGRQPL